MEFRPTELPEVVLVAPGVHRDARGFFAEVYHEARFREAGIDVRFVQTNHSRSARGVLRGLHAQVRRPQAKLVRVLAGEIFDVAVDVRPESPTFGRSVGFTLSSENFLESYVPAGFAHGFCVTSETADVEYKCSELYDPGDEIVIAWDDPELAIPWPIRNPDLSPRDRAAPRLRAVADRLRKA